MALFIIFYSYLKLQPTQIVIFNSYFDSSKISINLNFKQYEQFRIPLLLLQLQIRLLQTNLSITFYWQFYKQTKQQTKLYKKQMRLSKKLLNRHLSVMIIVFFQFFGTALFGFINLNIINRMRQTTSVYQKQIFTSVDYALSLFICISYGRQFSGGLYNPAITLFRMFRKTERIPVKAGLLYIFIQFIGSVCGCFLAFWVSDLKYSNIMTVLPVQQQLRRFYVQIMGTGIFAIMLQSILQKKMTFIQHNREFYICIPLFLMITRQYCAISNGMNPALGFGYELTYCYFSGKWQVMPMSYILIIGPWIGAILGVIIFEFLLKPLHPLKKVQIMHQIQQIQKQRQLKQQSLQHQSIITVRDLSFASLKYTMGQIINAQPHDSVYMSVDDDYTMMADDELLNQVQSVEDQDEQKQKDFDDQLQDKNNQTDRVNKNGLKSKKSFDSNLTFRVKKKFIY